MAIPEKLTTERLLLRHWLPSDQEPLAEMMADPLYNRFMPGPLPRSAAVEKFQLIQHKIESTGLGPWVLELPDDADFIGYLGLSIPTRELPCGPCVEIGWHLHPRYWGHGYATEAAQEAMRWGFEEHLLEEIVAFTVPENIASIGIMNKLGMTHDPAGDFLHPGLPDGHPLRGHLLYRKRRVSGETSRRGSLQDRC